MSDSDESGVTYTEDPYVEAALQAPPSPDYVPGPEEPKQAPPSPDYVPGPKHTDDEIVAEDQPGAEDASPTAQSPDYVPESDPEADPEEDDDEDPEEDPVDYSADGGDDGDDEDEPSEEDEDDDVDMVADMGLRGGGGVPAALPTLYQSPLPISVPTSSPPLLLPFASRREDKPEVTLPPRKRLGIPLGPGYEVGESSSVLC
ncbi:hypothetical protein Tco_1405220 [Tanacetum coccineum]